MYAVNWNRIEDDLDLTIWDRLTSNFWLPEKVALSNDLASWKIMSEEEKLLTRKVFAGLTMLDTVQSSVGAPALQKDAVTPHEEAVLANICFMEAVHAKSYSYIFSTLCSMQEIDETYRWAENDPLLKHKHDAYIEFYKGLPPEAKKVASVFLESFLFYSGFYWPLYLASRGKLTNTSDIIRLIIRDEALHGYYIGYKFQVAYKQLHDSDKEQVKRVADTLLKELMRVEVAYSEALYDPVGLTSDVKKFLCFNANKAMMNLGFNPPYSEEEANVSASIIAALNGADNHDFFSGSGGTYKVKTPEATTDDDWE